MPRQVWPKLRPLGLGHRLGNAPGVAVRRCGVETKAPALGAWPGAGAVAAVAVAELLGGVNAA